MHALQIRLIEAFGFQACGREGCRFQACGAQGLWVSGLQGSRVVGFRLAGLKGCGFQAYRAQGCGPWLRGTGLWQGLQDFGLGCRAEN